MTESQDRPDRQLPETATDEGPETVRDSGATRPGTRRTTGMGNPGTFGDDGGAVGKARTAAGGKLEDTARRVREMGDRAAQKNAILARTRPLAYNAADSIDEAADYVRSHELNEMRSDLESQVRRHPLASVAIAFLAGYTLRRIF